MNGHDTRSVHGSADTLGPQPSSLDFTHNMSPMLSRQDFANDLLGPEVSATPGSKAHDGSLARLKSWYMHESPWVPKSIVPGAEERYGNDPVVLSPDFSRPSFSHYRAGIALSDHDGLGTATHMSDSGYASAPPHYKHQDDDHTTMYEDDSQSLVQGLSDLTVPGASVDGFHAHESVSQHHGWDQPQPSVQAVSANVNPVAVSLGNYPCQVTGCGKSFRTKAEYK